MKSLAVWFYVMFLMVLIAGIFMPATNSNPDKPFVDASPFERSPSLRQFDDPLAIKPIDRPTELAMRVDLVRSRSSRSYLFADHLLMQAAQQCAEQIAAQETLHLDFGVVLNTEPMREYRSQNCAVLTSTAPTPVEAIRGWLQGDDAEVLLDPRYTQSGYGMAFNNNRTYWVAVLASPRQTEGDSQ